MVKSEKITILMSFLVAAFLDIKTINAYMAKGAEEGGYMAKLYLLVIGGILLLLLYKKNVKKLPRTSFFISAFLCISYLLTMVVYGSPRVSPIFFIVFTISSFIIPFLVEINARFMLKMMMVLSAPAILYINQIFTFQSLYMETISMGICYAFLTPIIASIVYMSCYFSNESFVQKIISLVLFAINIVFLLYLFLYGSRGPLVAVFSLIIILLLAKVSENGKGIVFNKRRIRFCILVSIILIGLGFAVFHSLNDFFTSRGINVRFIEKMLITEDAGDVSNGRNKLYEMAFSDFCQSPIWGRGVDRFSANHQVESYPHNFILQILSDGGLLLFLILFVPIIKRVRYLMKSCNIDRFAILLMLFFASVPGAMFSGDLWECSNLWFLFGALLSNRLIQSRNA